MEGKRFRVGSIAVLFAVVSLCMAIFNVLTMITAAADSRTARQYGDHVSQLYHCENLGQEWLGNVDAYLTGTGELPEGTWQDGDDIGTEITDGSMRLKIQLRETADGYQILMWSCTAQWQPDANWKLWE